MMLRLLLAALMLLLGLVKKVSAGASGAALVTVASPPWSAATHTRATLAREAACCQAILLEDGATPFGGDGKYLLPKEW